MSDADDSKPVEKGPSLFDMIKQWQVIVAVMAAMVSLWFSFSEYLQKKSELNRVAVLQATSQETRNAFISDPHNTINLMQVSYPRYGFCATLGIFAAHSSTLQVAVLRGKEVEGRANLALIHEALDEEMSRIAGPDLAERAAAIRRLDLDVGDDCAAIDAKPPFLSRWFGYAECTRAVEAYMENQCTVARERRQLERVQEQSVAALAEIEAERAKVKASEPTVADEAFLECDGCLVISEPALPDYSAVMASCPEPPLIYAQYRDPKDEETVRQILSDLRGLGWQSPGAELIEGNAVRGDVRYYYAEQEPCALALSTILSDLAESWSGNAQPFPHFSLAERFKDLPRGRMEIWFPVF